jgi:hypothetical protein
MTQFNDIDKFYTRAVLSFFEPRRRQLSFVVVFFMLIKMANALKHKVLHILSTEELVGLFKHQKLKVHFRL